ncbi:EF-P 5-aminopentanol modification-associated protein YfmF [Caloranaerobacter azorensis]|uniref:Insulinase family protein n=1 Tax=Caloranaerobacter azorensis TaxID=116090 RepID=A0A6P1YDA7_9FIRM|nr:pitrilysin family protein [Caloranaerobacter azorensis]QIB26703.1 insulinase family protein [Caloranaerobacter azorensis]
MTLKNIRKRIDEGVNLNLIVTDKFKSNLISIYIVRPLVRSEVTKNALLPMVLKRGTKNYNNFTDIQQKLEDLFGANLSVDVTKKGERQVIRFTLEGPNDKYVSGNNLIEEMIKILNEIINNPLLENGSFLDEYVNQEKENLKKKIESRINDKKTYSVDRCIEEMCKNENYSLYKHGYVEDLKDIDSRKLYKHYLTVLKSSPIEVCIVGDIDVDAVSNIFVENFDIKRDKVIDIQRENVLKEIHTKNLVREEMDVNQGKLTLGFRTNIPYEDKLYEPLLIMSNILGGGPNSKLFMNVREKESLAYYIYSRVLKYKSLLIISSGIEFSNYQKTLDIIKEQVEDMKLGKFSESDIRQAKKSLITSIKSIKDSNFSLADYYLSNILANDYRNIDEIIERLQNVSKDEIVEAAKKLSLDTIYFLTKRKK